jgi:hypothetical protein
VNRAKRTGRGLKVIKSGQEWRTLQEAINLDKEINDPNDEEKHASDEEDHPSDENDRVLVRADDTVPGKKTKDTPENGDEESDKAASGADGADDENCIIEKQERKIESKEEAEVEALEERVDDVSIESSSDEESSLASSDDDSSESDPSIPDIDDVNADWKLPELRDFIGGDEGAEKVVFFIHAISLASVGLLLSLAQ